MWCQVSHRPCHSLLFFCDVLLCDVKSHTALHQCQVSQFYLSATRKYCFPTSFDYIIYIHIRVYWVLCETVKAQISWEDNDAQLTAPGNSRPMPPTSLHTLGENFYHLGLLTKQKLEVQASKIKQKLEFQVSSLEIFPYLPLIPWIPMVKNRSGLLVLPEVACKRHLRKHQEMQPQPAGLVWGKSTGNPGLYH